MKKMILCGCIALVLMTGCAKENMQIEEKKVRENKSSPAPVEETTPMPNVTQPPAPVPQALGSAQTNIIDFQESRIHNIKLSIQKINGYILAPGASFSFNEIVGQRTADAGYQKATVLMHGEKTQDYGGGVCQVSTTLFQAARGAGLLVTERHSHQKDVGYAHPGDDAAVDYGNKDMCFVNNTEGTIKIEMTVGNGVIGATLYRQQ